MWWHIHFQFLYNNSVYYINHCAEKGSRTAERSRIILQKNVSFLRIGSDKHCTCSCCTSSASHFRTTSLQISEDNSQHYNFQKLFPLKEAIQQMWFHAGLFVLFFISCRASFLYQLGSFSFITDKNRSLSLVLHVLFFSCTVIAN